MRIGIVVFNGFGELDAIGPLEVFRIAAKMGGDFDAKLITRTKQKRVTGAHGLTVEPDGVYKPGEMDALLVVGGGWVDHAAQGVWAEVQNGDWLPLLTAEAQAGTKMLSVCTGAMLLANAGVIGEQRAATHHLAWDDLAATGAIIVPERVVDEGSVVTSGGVTSGIDLALWLVEAEGGPDLANAVSRHLEY